MDITKEEVLKLHELSEYEQTCKLSEWGELKEFRENVIVDEEKSPTMREYRIVPGFKRESLADCAFRLRDEQWIGKAVIEPKVIFIIGEWFTSAIGYDGDEKSWREWLYCEAKPIHWIQAALLCMIEKVEK